jgi:trehalose/maltose hydrolase-like predicted phosphorylase
LRNNAYINIMAVWALCRSLDVLDRCRSFAAPLTARLGLTPDEAAR